MFDRQKRKYYVIIRSYLFPIQTELKFKDKVFKTIIPRNVKIAEAPSHGKPVVIYDPDCKGSLAYKQLTEELISYESFMVPYELSSP